MKRFFYLFLKRLKTFLLIVRTSYIKFQDNHGRLIANGLAFKTIFALAPVLIIATGAFSIFPQFVPVKDMVIDFLKNFIVPSSFDKVLNMFNSIFDKTGTLSIISIFIFIYLSLDLLITLDNQVERIWASKLKRSIIQKILKYWALLSATPLVLGGYFYYSGLIRSFLALTPLSSFTYFTEILYSLVSLLLLWAFIFFLYFLIPDTKIHVSKALIISASVSIFWILLRFVFTYYTKVLISRWDVLYGSFAVFIFFILWTSINWIVLLFGVEFLYVWQNKLYIRHVGLTKLFLFDISFLILILEEFNADFKSKGSGIELQRLAEKLKCNQEDVEEMVNILVLEGFVIGDNSPIQLFYLKRDISRIKLVEIETIIWNRLKKMNYGSTSRLQEISDKLGKYYLMRKKKSAVFINEILLGN